VPSEVQDRYGERTNEQEVDHPVDGNEAQHDAVPQGPPRSGKRDVLACRRKGRVGADGAQGEPGVAAQAAVPAQRVVRVAANSSSSAERPSIGADELVSEEATADQL